MQIAKARIPFCVTTLIALSYVAQGQQSASVLLPEAPGMNDFHRADIDSSSSDADTSLPQATPPGSSVAATHQDNQPKRILGILPNFRAVNVGAQLPPQSVKDKFITASQDSFDYSSIVLPAAIAGESYLATDTPEFGKGGVGYGRYLWHAVVDQTSENYFVEFIVPAIAHEDTRYYTLGTGGFAKRAGYSLSRIVVTRSDSGKRTFNSGEIVGAGFGSALSNAYYPAPERTVSNTMTRFGTNVGVDAFTFFFKEFWPDINHKLFHGAAQ